MAQTELRMADGQDNITINASLSQVQNWMSNQKIEKVTDDSDVDTVIDFARVIAAWELEEDD